MTAVTDFMTDAAKTPANAVAGPIQTLNRGRLMMRGSQNLLGGFLILTAIGFWVMPGSDFSSDVVLMKLVLSLIAALAGIAMMDQGKAPAIPEVEIDTVRREIRLVRHKGKHGECVQSCKFSDLDRAEVHGTHVILWGQDDVMLAEVALNDPQLRRSLMRGLSTAGKL